MPSAAACCPAAPASPPRSFTETLGDLKDVIQQNFNEKVLSGIDLFSGLDSSERNMLIEHLTEENFQSGQPIIRQGDQGESFYIIKSGTVRVTSRAAGSDKEDIIKDSMGAGSYFGERALAKSEPRMATVTATSEVHPRPALPPARRPTARAPTSRRMNPHSCARALRCAMPDRTPLPPRRG